MVIRILCILSDDLIQLSCHRHTAHLLGGNPCAYKNRSEDRNRGSKNANKSQQTPKVLHRVKVECTRVSSALLASDLAPFDLRLAVLACRHCRYFTSVLTYPHGIWGLPPVTMPRQLAERDVEAYESNPDNLTIDAAVSLQTGVGLLPRHLETSASVHPLGE